MRFTKRWKEAIDMLWFKKKSNKNIADAVRRGKTITNTHAAEIEQLETHQRYLAEENAEIQREIINIVIQLEKKSK